MPFTATLCQWIDGDISGEWAARKLLDHLFLDADTFESSKERNLSLAAQMYTKKVGGCLLFCAFLGVFCVSSLPNLECVCMSSLFK